MYKLILLLATIAYTNFTWGQEKVIWLSAKKQKRNKSSYVVGQEEGIDVYKKQLAFGMKLNTDGYSAFFEKGIVLTPLKARLFQIELGERIHPKEIKIVPGGRGTLPRKYVYGKINNFYYAKASYALQHVLGNKGSKNGVEVLWIYGGGISAGLLKPYYIKVGTPRTVQNVRYNNNEDVFLNNPQQVYGATGVLKGFGEIKVTPGVLMKTALRFNHARYNTFLSALEIGVNAEIYAKQMQQLLLVEKEQLFMNAYAAIVFGKRK